MFQRSEKNEIPGNAEWISNRTFLTDNLPILGSWILSDEGTPAPKKISNKTKPFLILIWKNGKFLERRHLRRFSRDK